MSFISLRHKLIFIHIAKTGGKSMNVLLKNHCKPEIVFNTKSLIHNTDQLGKRIALEAMKLTSNEVWDSCFKFAFVRNTWDRTVSMYEHLKESYRSQMSTGGTPNDKIEIVNSILDVLNIKFEDFTFEVFVKSIIRDQMFKNYHWDLQLNCISDGEDRIVIDYIGRFESLEKDFGFVCSHVGLPKLHLPHFHKSNHSHYAMYYTNELVKIVGDFYKKDNDYFQYKFNHSI